MDEAWRRRRPRGGHAAAGVVLLQDVRLEGELAPGPRAKDHQGKWERCMGGTYACVWGALGDRVIPVPMYGVEAAGRWAAVGVRGRAPTAKIAFIAVYRPPGGLGGEGANLVKRYGRLLKEWWEPGSSSML